MIVTTGSNPRVLLAEDSPVSQRIEAGLLRSLGFDVVACSDGAEAVEQFGSQAFDLVLLDCQMPRLGGIEAAAAIRAAETPGTARTPIIALSASVSGEDRARCQAAGIDYVLSKPFDQNRLWEAVLSAKG